DRRAHAGDRRRPGHAVLGPMRVHRQEDPRRAPGDDRGRRPLVEPRSARSVQPYPAGVSRLAAAGEGVTEMTAYPLLIEFVFGTRIVREPEVVSKLPILHNGPPGTSVV